MSQLSNAPPDDESLAAEQAQNCPPIAQLAVLDLAHHPSMHPIPRPEEHPTMRLWPEVGNLLGLSRSTTYEAARRGEIPIIRFGRRIIVPTAALRRMVGLDTPIP